MILENIIYDVRESLKAYTDDSEISNEYIIYLYGIKRSKYLRQDLNNYQRTTDISVTQTLCLGLERVSVNECGLDLDCATIVRTKKPIPQPLELHIKSAITSVKSTERISIPFNFVTKQKAIYSQYSPFNKAIFAFLDNDKYIYLISEDETLNLLECLTITGVFEDPLELANYSNCCSCENMSPCFDEMTSNYPLQPHYIDLIKNEIVNELIKKLNIQEDTKNNSVDDKE
jgi:hypothetical protein